MARVGVGSEVDVFPPIPGRQPLVEGHEEASRIGAAVDEHPAATATLNQHRIALADVEHDHARDAVRAVRDDEAKAHDGGQDASGGDPPRPTAHDHWVPTSGPQLDV